MSTYNSADMPVLQVQLDVIQQEITYNSISKTIPESYWTDELVPFLYPLWDSDKDKLISFNFYTNNTYFAKRRKYVKNFKTGEFQWIDYEMEQVDVVEAVQLKDKLIEAFYLLDSIAEDDYEKQLARMYSKQKQVSPLTVRIARNFLLDETDWAILPDCGLSDEDKQMYIKYRQKLRDLTKTIEFSTDVESTKFPISPELYKNLYFLENPEEEYLETPAQYIPLGKHYLKQFRDRIAQYMVLKSLTEKNYFDTLLSEYETVRISYQPTPDGIIEDNLTPEEIEMRKEWLEKLLIHVQTELDEGNTGEQES
jgi:hypothetical protein